MRSIKRTASIQRAARGSAELEERLGCRAWHSLHDALLSPKGLAQRRVTSAEPMPHMPMYLPSGEGTPRLRNRFRVARPQAVSSAGLRGADRHGLINSSAERLERASRPKLVLECQALGTRDSPKT